MSEVAFEAVDTSALEAVGLASWPAYSEYKDSGAEWPCLAPSHWGVRRLRFSVKTNPTKSELKGYDPLTEVSFVPMEAVGEYGGLNLVEQKIIEDVAAGYTYFRDGDVLVAKITPCFENGKGALASGLINSIGFGTTELHVVRPDENELDSHFLFYLSISHTFRKLGEAEMYGAGGQKRIPEDFIKDFRGFLPPLLEQQAIAAFLDRETSRIDDLIAKKQQLIDLLQEKRTALISQAVTKGLDPGVPMKDSGVEWLGVIPAHWEVSRVKFIVTTPVTDGPHETPEILADGIPFVSAEAINNGKINFTKIRGHISEEEHKRFSRKYCPKLGDIYMVKSGATTGRVAMVEDDRVFNIWSPLAAIRCDIRKANRRFVYHYLQSKEFQSGVQLRWSFGTQQNIGMGVIQNLAIPLPDIDEQSALASILDRDIVRFDAISFRVSEAIGQLNEYRSALISAAVTGKIDVREKVS